MYFILLEEVNLLLNLRYLEQFFATGNVVFDPHSPRKESHDFPGTGTCDKITF